jgi:hypothetical protein
MEVSPNALRRDTMELLQRINKELAKQDDLRLSLSEERLVPLLLAKAQCLNTLTLLNEQGKKR